MSTKEDENPIADFVFTKDDFDRCNWKDAILSCKKNDCLEYGRSFDKKAKQAAEEGNSACHKVFQILSVISYPILRGDLADPPFTPPNTVELLSNKQLEVLKELVPELSDAEMRARVTDILWLRNRDYKMGECAVKCYLESSTVLEQAGEVVHVHDRIERAMRIAMQLGNDALLSKVTSHIESLLERCDNDRCSVPTLLLMKAVLENRKKLSSYQRIDPTGYAGLAERAAKRQASGHHWIAAEQYWSIAAAWHRISGNDNEARHAQIMAAETYVADSEDAINSRDKPSYLVAHHLLQQALMAYRAIPNTEERVEELHKRLIEDGKKVPAEMHVVSTELELDQTTIVRARDSVKGKTIRDALFTLAFMVQCPRVGYLRSLAQDAFDNHQALFLFQRKTFNKLGKVVATSPSGVFGETEREATITAEMFSDAQLIEQVIVASVIEPARKQINLEHQVRVDDIYPLLRNNPYIPPGKEAIFARGLYYGLTGDFLLSTHLLIPQLENSMRSIVDQLGGVTSGLDDKGIQQERDLNRLLYRPYAQLLEGILGEDMIFDMRGLLVEEHGSNLRNNLAHGFIDSMSFWMWPHTYLWWIVLHLCCRPFLANAQPENGLDTVKTL
jgi:hypothetical protein